MVRRFRKRARSVSDSDGQKLERGKFGALWLILALVVLAAVIGYDQHGVKQARERMASARELERKGMYQEALKEYESALSNVRIGRRDKGEIALAIADIQFSRFGNYAAAVKYYGQAKQDSPKLFHSANAHERMKQAAERANGGVGNGSGNAHRISDERTSATRRLSETVELLKAPAEDQNGPVLARYNGGEVRAGEILRALRGTSELNDPTFRNDPGKLQQLLKTHLKRVLQYEAALDAKLQNDPSVEARLYEYQRNLLAERYAGEARRRALTITMKQVEDYYERHKGEFVAPGAFRLGLIKASTKEKADRALDRLRKGESFSDVASSESEDSGSAAQGGDAGRIAADATSIQGIGDAKELLAELRAMKSQSVSDVASIGGAFYIFKILEVIPEKSVTIDQARPHIEMKLRGETYEAATKGLDKQLEERFAPEIDRDNILKFWEFAARSGDNQTTDPIAAAGATSQTLDMTPQPALPSGSDSRK